MSVNLTEHQLMVVKSMEQLGESFANQIYHIMQNHGLDQVKGFSFGMKVFPEYDFTTMSVDIGYSIGSDAGCISMTRGKNDEKYVPTGINSAEYELLFADEAVRERMAKILSSEKPLPPDGLWVGRTDNGDYVGSWEWDMNDSLS